eukprot:scaffold20755_cov82-Skeletonema_dohrnii-CCMP3373.AAC.2
MEAGVVDPAKVTINAVENSASVAGLVLTTECLVTEIPVFESEEDMQRRFDAEGMGAGMGMGGRQKTYISPPSCGGWFSVSKDGEDKIKHKYITLILMIRSNSLYALPRGIPCSNPPHLAIIQCHALLTYPPNSPNP